MVKVIVMVKVMVIILALLVSCGPGGNSFRLSGRFRDMQTGELYIYNLNGDHARLDTINIQNGKFRYKGETNQVTPYILLFPNGVEQVIFAGPGEDLEYEATANDLKNYVVSGSEENELMNKFREETYTLNPSTTTNTARIYIKDNPASPVAIYLFDHYFAQNEEVSDTELTELLKVLRPKHPHNHYLLDIESKLHTSANQQIGKTLPNITLTTKDRNTVPLWATTRDYTLIAFWATWMNNGTDYLWQLKNALTDYRDSGRIRLVAISLDIERYRWEDVIRPDTTANYILHACDGLSFESPTVKALGIDHIPCYILTDKNHKILDTGQDINQLTSTLKKNIH